MKRILFSSILILLLVPGVVFSQRDSLRTVFRDAESWFLFEEYAEALPLYLGMHEIDPGNDNLKYKIGVCLLNDPYRKDKAIEYLLEASKNINPNYKENSYKETTAPPDVLYYLGDAYRVNELLDRAIDAYEKFIKIMDRDIYDEELALAQIRACENAKRLKTMPVDIDLLLLDSPINTHYANIHPVISGDGSRMAFVTKLPFYDGAFYCEKTGEGWSYPQEITQSLGFDADIYPASLSHDGSEMILYYDDDYIGNLYYSRYEDGRWLPATILDDNISTRYWESHGSFSKDGKTLYFTSNRKGTNGGLDIYKSERQPDGKWGVAENLGPNINSRYNEETPFITEDGQTLYFSSYGHFNMGGYDIFYSKKSADGSWGEPINLGYSINTTDDDLFFQPVNNGFNAYYSLYSPGGLGAHDIYYMDIYSADNPRIYFVSEELHSEDGTMDTDTGGIKLDHIIELALAQKEPVIFEGEETRKELRDTLQEAVGAESVFAVIDPEDEESGDVPVEEPVNVLVEEPVDVPVEESGDVLAEGSGDVPVEEVEMAQPFQKDSSGTLQQELQEEPGDRGDKEPGKRIYRKVWPTAIITGVGIGSLILIFLWRRRRKNRENSTE